MWRKAPEAKPSSSSAAFDSPDKPSGGTATVRESDSKGNSPSRGIQTSQTSSSHLPAGLRLNGTLSGNSDLTIDTQFEGAIEVPDSTVRIGTNGRVESAIVAREITVQGTVAGNLQAKGSIVLEQGSSVRGNLSCRRIRIDDGASFRGSVEMGEPKKESAAVASVATTSAPSQQPDQTQPGQTQQQSPAPRVIERSVAAKAKAAE